MSTSAIDVQWGTIRKLDPYAPLKPLSPIQKSTAITVGEYFGLDLPSPYTTTEPVVSRAIFTGSGGDITVMQKDETTVAYTNLPAGRFLPVQAVKVTASTVASGVLWCY